MKRFVLLILVAFLSAATSSAHPHGVGHMKNQCETLGEGGVHEYGQPSTGFALVGDWVTVVPFGNAQGPAVEDVPTAPFTRSLGLVLGQSSDGSIPPCPFGDSTWDGHYEFAYGGARLQAAASVCTDAYADHTPGSIIHVVDAVLTLQLASDVAFSVYADTLNNDPVPWEPNCGDFESDYGVDCVNSCAPGFPPGLDGTYQVYVSGTTGHILNGGNLPHCSDGLDNDEDGLVDWPLDLACEHQEDGDESA